MRRWIEENLLKRKEFCFKVIITFFLLLIYRLATYIPLPGISFNEIINQSTKGIIQIVYSLAGLNFSSASILSLGVMPYISSSIFIHFINFAFPFLPIVNKEIKYITRCLTIVICFIQSPVYLIALTSQFLPFFYKPKAYILDLSDSKSKGFFF